MHFVVTALYDPGPAGLILLVLYFRMSKIILSAIDFETGDGLRGNEIVDRILVASKEKMKLV